MEWKLKCAKQDKGRIRTDEMAKTLAEREEKVMDLDEVIVRMKKGHFLLLLKVKTQVLITSILFHNYFYHFHLKA